MHAKAIADRLELARFTAREAGQYTLRFFNQNNYAVELKADDSPVTVADRGAEELLRQHIAAAFPQDGILGEELGEQTGASGFRWILDPIDGTKSFISGVPMYGTMVGVEFDGRAVVGAVYIPGTDELVYAGVGHGCWFQSGGKAPVKAHVSSRGKLGDSLFVTTAVKTFTDFYRREAYDLLESACRLTRTWGDCYGYLLVATGRAELMIDPAMNVWDAAALQPILEEAGGTFTDWQGRATIHSGEGVATNGLVLDEVLAITRRFAR